MNKIKNQRKPTVQTFDEYIRQGEPDRKEKAQNWQTAIGLQQVDGLKPSAYLIETAKRNIEGDITFDEVKNRLDAYYKTQTHRQTDADDRTEEADKVSARIAEILSEKTFSFSPAEYINIHRRLFLGIYEHAGKIRDYNISKSEWVLDGETVLYAGAEMLEQTLEYDFQQERVFSYSDLSQQQIIGHIARFTAYLWQIHVFEEGNTRTTAVFLIKYLRKLGFKDTNNNLFAQHSWYFRNALVRANYENVTQGVCRTDKYLVRFLSNILLNGNYVLKNRELHVRFVENSSVKTQSVGEMSEKCRRNVGEMPEKQSKIIEFIEKNKYISAKQLSELLHVSDRTIEREIKKMKEMKIIERTGGDRGGSWKILENGEGSNLHKGSE